MELLFAMIAYLLGILLGLYFKIGIAFFILLSIIICYYKGKNKWLRYIIIFNICCIISFLQITYAEKSFKEKYRNISQEIKVIGTIISNPSQKDYTTQYTLKVESVNGDTSYKNTNLLLQVKNEKNIKLYSYGNKICVIGEFKEPSMQRNEGGFDYRQYLKTKKIYGILTTKINQIDIKKENNVNFILKLANTISNKIKEKANSLLDEKKASLLIGILIGDKENLEEDIQEAFKKSNLSHILAVSGAHTSYVLLAISAFIKISKIGKRKGKIITIIFLIFFILITGKTSSVSRACFMTIYFIISSLFYKRVSIISSISISMLILMIINPYCILEIGFQLSYGGTLGIVFLYKPLKKYINSKIKQSHSKIKEKIIEIVLITISANIILIPIMIYHFNTLSITFVISNLLASPIMGIIVILGFITILISFIFPFIANLFAIPLKIFLTILIQIATFTSKIPFSQIKLITPKIYWIIIYYTVIILFIWNKKTLVKFKKIFIIILAFILLFSCIYKQIPKQLRIYFIDVGQGDSTLIITPRNKTILIDGGGSKDTESFDVGKNTLIPYLLDRGISKLDYILISHFDSDHIRWNSKCYARFKS